MSRCEECKYAVWDYCTYYNTTKKNWFVVDCSKGLDNDEDGEDCPEFKEADDGEYH